MFLLRRIALPALTVLLLQILVLSVLNCCLALSLQPTGLMPDFESELPCYCSSVAAKSLFVCTELLSGPGLPTERVYAQFGLKLPSHRSAAAISRFFCTELLGLLLFVFTLRCSEFLRVVLNVTCDTLTSLNSVVAASNRTGACPI